MNKSIKAQREQIKKNQELERLRLFNLRFREDTKEMALCTDRECLHCYAIVLEGETECGCCGGKRFETIY